MRLRLTKVDQFQFLTCLKHQVWGSKSARFKDWKVGDYLGFIVKKSIAGLAEVSGPPYVSQERVWDNGIFPHRIPIKFTHVLYPVSTLHILGEIRDALTSSWGPRYGWGILNQQLLPSNSAEVIIKSIHSQRNDLDEVQAHIDSRLSVEKDSKNLTVKIIHKKGRPKLGEDKSYKIEVLVGSKDFGSKKEESEHSKTQNALIQLGKTTGCLVWIASNDRSRIFKNKPLGDLCIKTLPNLGLSEEATRRISLIDIIWLRQNAPICAFEVETTSSIYSGLLRMSDLLSVVPALNIKLFIVAPRERQNKVMAELSRPTFQKIGLSEFCRFIATEDLYSLISKVADFSGHVQHSIVDKIAVELEEEIESTLE